MYLVKTPWLLKKLYSKLVWNTNDTSRCIYLTFDDGPIPIVTLFVLNILKQYNARATFFCIGDNAGQNAVSILIGENLYFAAFHYGDD